jgi:hypothetical protein
VLDGLWAFFFFAKLTVQEVAQGLKLHVCRYFKIQKWYFKVSKNLELNLHIDNVVLYKHAYLQVEITYIQSCARIKKIQIYKISKSVRLCHFCSDIRHLDFKFYTLVLVFFETSKYCFLFF